MKPYLIIAFLLFILLYQYCKNDSLKKHNDKTVTTLTDSVIYFSNKLGSQTASVKTLKIERSQLKQTLFNKNKELEKLISEFKNIRHLTDYKSITVVDSIKINFQDSIPFTFNRNGHIAERWYNLKYAVNNKGMLIDSLTIPTHTTVISGIKRKWFLGSECLTTDITNSNPHIKTIEIKSAEITLKQPWYKKWYIWMATGAVCGWIVTK